MSESISLPAAVTGERRELGSSAGLLSYYCQGPAGDTGNAPLLLIHSINAAGSAYEMKPLYEHYCRQRMVYALELPGFGFSERSERAYTPRLMSDAIQAMVTEIQRLHDMAPIDALALSLSCEFLARTASENPEAYRSIALISPTGFDKRGPRNGPPGSHRGSPVVYKIFTFSPWEKGFYQLLTSRPSIRFFLKKTWGSAAIDEGLFEYDYLTSHQPGARHAPYYFVSGFLFSNDITRVYESLKMPVWMTHGVRGDFTDYSAKDRFELKPNWSFQVFQTGALSYFEVPDEFIRGYDGFLAAAG
jgi:pimeloyl-ACP methyl ester carboxylesterase